MSIATVRKSDDSAKAEEAQKNRLGISRAIYATGYSFKDAFIWGTAATVAVFGIITLGSKKFPRIKTLEDMLIKGHKSWKNWSGQWLKEGVGSVAIIAGFLVGHLVQIPSGAVGWRKAQAAINKHNTLSAEKDQLVEANTGLMEDNGKLRVALAEAEKSRPSFTERARTNAAEVNAAQSP